MSCMSVTAGIVSCMSVTAGIECHLSQLLQVLCVM